MPLNIVSHPTRVRGLKHFQPIKTEQAIIVAPHTGAWIETFQGFHWGA